jgi:chorismate dehydratase
MSKTVKAKVGLPYCLCTSPIGSVWNRTAPKDLQLIEDTPAGLEKKLLDHSLDISFVSSLFFARHPANYRILPGLSITASGAGAVYLFSHVPLQQLKDASVYLAAECETGKELAKLVLEDFNSVKPRYTEGDVSEIGANQYDAILVDGDTALRFLEEATHLYQFDLGDIWKRETGLPLVLSVCLVRDDYCKTEKETVISILGELLRCRNEGATDLEGICQISASTIPFTNQKCLEYLEAIDFDLGGKKQESLKKLYAFWEKRGVISSKIESLNLFTEVD